MDITTQFSPWTSLVGGILIGLSAGLFILLNGRVAGISGLLGSLLSPGEEGFSEKSLFLLGLFVTPLIGYLVELPGAIKVDTPWYLLVIAGLLVGLGTGYGSGCTSGHGVCGLSRLSKRSFVAVGCFMAAGFATVYLTRHSLGV